MAEMKVLAVTGYRPMEINIFNENDEKIKFVKRAIKKRLLQFIDTGLEWVIVSGQMGVEMWTAEVVLDLKDTYDINLAVVPPFLNQAKRWSETLQYKYEELLLGADFYEPIYQEEYKGPYQFQTKDLWLIEKSDACMLLLDEENPGSVQYFREKAALAHNYPIYTITPFDLEEVVLEMQMEDPTYWND